MRPQEKTTKKTEKLNFWQSYSDMMAALLLVFVLILSGTLLEARETYEKKEEELKEKENIIAEQQEQIDAVIGVRSDLIDALRLEFADSDFSVSVDSQTGAIMFPSSLLFESGKYELRSSGVEFLEAFLPKYFSILLGDDFSPYVAEIIIEGHTDTEGGYMYNLQLSQNRALAVATYCLDENSEILSEEQTERLRVLLTANGRSWSSPVYYENGEVNMEASRRVEIKFRLKDQEMMEELAEILEGF